jgi:hypothetical protein
MGARISGAPRIPRNSPEEGKTDQEMERKEEAGVDFWKLGSA